MPSTLSKPIIYTAEEYFDLDNQSEIRHEFHNGSIVPMTGGTPNHSELVTILSALLWFKLKDQPYRVFGGDLRLWIPQKNLYTYPDLMIVKHPILLQEGRKDTVTNPTLIIEVLSNSTKNYDRVDKFAAYRTIPTFEEYLLVDQYQPHVEHYVRQNDRQWLFNEYDDQTGQILLTSLGIEVSLADLYATIEFAPDDV